MENIKALFDSRKWFDFSEEIKAFSGGSSDDLNKIVEMLEATLLRMHPTTIASTVVALQERLPHKEAEILMEKAVAAIQSQAGEEHPYTTELVAVRMRLCARQIQDGNPAGCESDILGWLRLYDAEGASKYNSEAVPFSRENWAYLQHLAYFYYSAIGQVEQAQTFLLAFVSLSGDESQMDMLVKLSILSRSFFGFAEVSYLNAFRSMEGNPLLSLYRHFELGKVEENGAIKDKLMVLARETLGERADSELISTILEKALLMRVLRVCSKASQRCVSFDVLLDELGLESEDILVPILVKALGYGLVSGHIDSRNRTLCFDRLYTGATSESSLENMKERFIIWKGRVAEAIELIECNK